MREKFHWQSSKYKLLEFVLVNNYSQLHRQHVIFLLMREDDRKLGPYSQPKLFSNIIAYEEIRWMNTKIQERSGLIFSSGSCLKSCLNVANKLVPQQ